ncbi:MAG TPA: hypothetical protein PKD83_00515 [Ignavibacteria bacterium]|nr:hypothetical protein [Ignavibacteria bacterium]
MRSLIFITFVISAIITSCSEKKPETVIKKDSTEIMTIKKDTTLIVKKEMKTKSGKIYTIVESKPGYSLSNFYISGSGFKNSHDTLKYPNKNPMTNAVLSDLDNNGFEEMYVFTKSTGSESFMEIIGVASLNDTSFGEIIVQEITTEDVEKNEKFNGYMGHDSVYISGKKIFREFPVYKSSSSGTDSTDGRRRIIYMLKTEDNNYQLYVTGSEEIK